MTKNIVDVTEVRPMEFDLAVYFGPESPEGKAIIARRKKLSYRVGVFIEDKLNSLKYSLKRVFS